ncbi:uncharacterized protein [Drosophila takahashii]|uniref:uncharacterized protein n=1 Tax=Drosophila takahashii TaxID=29030 RepID=UPI001CF8EE1A|nr:uncharacterized protein LOC123002512 [Drosophila takahashii]
MQSERRQNFRQPWFDSQCQRTRKHAFKQLQNIRKNTNDETKHAYQTANTAYKSLCKAKEAEYYQRLEMEIGEIRDSKGFWEMAKKLNGLNTRQGGIKVTALSLGVHFKGLLQLSSRTQINYALPYVEINELDEPIRLSEVQDAVRRSKVKKAPGFDRVPAEFYKNASTELISLLTLVYNRIFEDRTAPESFKRNIIFPIFKKENRTAVWDGKTLSEWFEINKEGCLLSPLLFFLFVDDITEGLPEGVLFADHQIKVLMYAHDMVMLAGSPETLQNMINYTHAYCTNWNLQINLDKSKVMCIKDPRGRLARDERWTLNGTEIEVVKEYKYLGTVLSSNMSFKKHLQQKLKDAKVALNSTWSCFLAKQEVKSSNEYKLFEATSKAIMCNSAEV